MRKWNINRIKYALKDPSAAIKFVLSGRVGVNLLCLRRIATSLGCSKIVANTFLNQILSDEEFHRKVWINLHKLNYIGWINFPEGLYVLMKIPKPKIVVETGVATGVSSAYILKALEELPYAGPEASIDYS